MSRFRTNYEAGSSSGEARKPKCRGPKPKPVIKHPEPLFEPDTEPATFTDALALQMRRHGDTCWHLHKAVVRPRERFDRRTLQDWVTGGCVPRSTVSMAVLARIEQRYRLLAGYFKSLLPHPGRATTHPHLRGIETADQRRLAWHLPDDFSSRPLAERAEILHWVRTRILAGSTEYRRFQAEASKHPYALRFDRGCKTTRRASAQDLRAPPDLQQEMEALVTFKSSTLTPIGLRRNGVWCGETCAQRIEHFSLMFGAMSASPDFPISGLGLPSQKLTFALLVFPSVWDWYLDWRARRRGFFTTWEVDMLRLGVALCRRETGWLRQSPHLSERLTRIESLVSEDDVHNARTHWLDACDRLCAFATFRSKEVERVARVHRDPFEPILPVLEASAPLREYRSITEEIVRRMPDARRYPVAAAEAVRAFLMLRLGLHLGVRQRNLRQLMLCKPGGPQRSERELEELRRGELRWLDETGEWEVFIPSRAFKNARSSFFGNRPFRLILPDLGELYLHLHNYVRCHRDVLLRGHTDPGTVLVKTVKTNTRDASYGQNAFYEAWRLAIQRYGIWNPYTKRGAIPGLLPHGPHSVRDVLATHILKLTGSYEQASYAIQDIPATVAKHYGRFLPQDKTSLAAQVLNKAWE